MALYTAEHLSAKSSKAKLGPLLHQNRCIPSQRILIVSLAFWINLCQLRIELFQPPLAFFSVPFLLLSSWHIGNCQNCQKLGDKLQESHSFAGEDDVDEMYSPGTYDANTQAGGMLLPGTAPDMIKLQQYRQAALCHSPSCA